MCTSGDIQYNVTNITTLKGEASVIKTIEIKVIHLWDVLNKGHGNQLQCLCTVCDDSTLDIAICGLQVGLFLAVGLSGHTGLRPCNRTHFLSLHSGPLRAEQQSSAHRKCAGSDIRGRGTCPG